MRGAAHAWRQFVTVRDRWCLERPPGERCGIRRATQIWKIIAVAPMSTRWLVGTSVLIDHLRGTAAARNLLLGGVRDGVELWSAVVVRTEVLAGMRSKEKRATLQLLGLFRWLDITADLAGIIGHGRNRPRSHFLAGICRMTAPIARRGQG